jgi:hypothetical protein
VRRFCAQKLNGKQDLQVRILSVSLSITLAELAQKLGGTVHRPDGGTGDI